MSTATRNQMIVGATLDDLVHLTGQSRTWCKEKIRNGLLPGKKVGNRYIVPDLELDAWRRGEWEPTPAVGQPMLQLVRKVKTTG